jgi:hypothetical protein
MKRITRRCLFRGLEARKIKAFRRELDVPATLAPDGA